MKLCKGRVDVCKIVSPFAIESENFVCEQALYWDDSETACFDLYGFVSKRLKNETVSQSSVCLRLSSLEIAFAAISKLFLSMDAFSIYDSSVILQDKLDFVD